MKEYVLFFRMDITTREAQPTQEQMKIYMTSWNKWVNEISSAGRLAKGGKHLHPSGKILKPKNVLFDGPYTTNNESVAGYILILASNIEEAVAIARKCPILQGEGTSVEVRETDVVA